MKAERKRKAREKKDKGLKELRLIESWRVSGKTNGGRDRKLKEAFDWTRRETKEGSEEGFKSNQKKERSYRSFFSFFPSLLNSIEIAL